MVYALEPQETDYTNFNLKLITSGLAHSTSLLRMMRINYPSAAIERDLEILMQYESSEHKSTVTVQGEVISRHHPYLLTITSSVEGFIADFTRFGDEQTFYVCPSVEKFAEQIDQISQAVQLEAM